MHMKLPFSFAMDFHDFQMKASKIGSGASDGLGITWLDGSNPDVKVSLDDVGVEFGCIEV